MEETVLTVSGCRLFKAHHCVFVCFQKQSVQVKPSAKENQWFDVGIVKVTNMVVTHYYVPFDGNVIDVRAAHCAPSTLTFNFVKKQRQTL